MRHRALHLAGLLLLLTTLSSAEAATLRDGRPAFGAHYISVLIAQQEAATATQTTFTPGDANPLALTLPANDLAQYNATWTMRPPSAHSVSLHAVTGSSL